LAVWQPSETHTTGLTIPHAISQPWALQPYKHTSSSCFKKKESGFGIVMAQKGRKYIKWTQKNPFKNTNELFSKSQHFNNSLEILEVWLMIS